MQPPGKEQGMTRISSSQKEKRDLEMLRKFRGGMKPAELAACYGLGVNTVRTILSKVGGRGRTKNEDECSQEAQRFHCAISRFRRIREGDIVRMYHTVHEADGMRNNGVMTGVVIYKDGKILTVKGDHYAESFQMFDLATKLKEHIPC